MRKRLKVKRHGKATLAVAALMAGPVAVACSTGPSAEEWAATDGAAGRINLNEVQEAFKKSNSATDFEDRVNQIYEGDHIVLIRAKQDGQTLVLEGWEDLNSTKTIEDGCLQSLRTTRTSTSCAATGPTATTAAALEAGTSCSPI